MQSRYPAQQGAGFRMRGSECGRSQSKVEVVDVVPVENQSQIGPDAAVPLRFAVPQSDGSERAFDRT